MTRELSPYVVLGVEPRADSEEISIAYRRLAARFHPDRDPSPRAHTLMLLVNAAHEVLKVPARRAAYDAQGPQPPPSEVRQSHPEPSPPAAAPPQAIPDAPATMPPLARRMAALDGIPRNRATVLTSGRYAGRSLAEMASIDRAYLEWLADSPGGRQYRLEIQQLIGVAGRH